jgi:hypothetical protein
MFHKVIISMNSMKVGILLVPFQPSPAPGMLPSISQKLDKFLLHELWNQRSLISEEDNFYLLPLSPSIELLRISSSFMKLTLVALCPV